MSELNKKINEAKAGNYQSFGYIYEMYVNKIYRYVFVRTGHKQVAEDLTSDVFFKVLKKLSSFGTNDENFNAWIYTIARNTVIDHYRTSKVEVGLELVLDKKDATDLNSELSNRMLLREIEDELKNLSEREREVVWLRVWDGLSHSEIASVLGVSQSAVKVAFMRGLSKLRSKAKFIMCLGLLKLWV